MWHHTKGKKEEDGEGGGERRSSRKAKRGQRTKMTARLAGSDIDLRTDISTSRLAAGGEKRM